MRGSQAPPKRSASPFQGSSVDRPLPGSATTMSASKRPSSPGTGAETRTSSSMAGSNSPGTGSTRRAIRASNSMSSPIARPASATTQRSSSSRDLREVAGNSISSLNSSLAEDDDASLLRHSRSKSTSVSSSTLSVLPAGANGKARDKAAVKVCVRIRPLEVVGGEKRRDNLDHNKLCWRYDARSLAPSGVVGAPRDEIEAQGFTFDNVFAPMTSTEQIYRQVLSEIVQSTVDGYNGCIFAYGQTSSGKTFTMTGSRSSPGVISLAANEVFSHVRKYPDREFFFRLSYIEIYNEVVIDLLDPTKTGLQIRSSEQASGVVKIVGVTEKVVTSVSEVMTTVQMGESHRSTGSTDMNEKSSRSHTTFRLVVESRRKDTVKGGAEYRVSSLNLVDLAGSESASKAGSDGQRRTEGSYINKSLLTLATVIQRLITASGHIPYRDSKLTRILEPALGGNSRTAVICTVTPAMQHFSESLNTLKFAARAKKMKNKPILNDVIVSVGVGADDVPLLKKYRDEIEALRKEKELLEHLNEQQREELEHEKGQVEETRSVLHEKIHRYESMIVDLDSMSRESAKRPFAFKFRTTKAAEEELRGESEHRVEDASIVFGKLKQHVTGLQSRLILKVEALSEETEAASRASLVKEREVAEFVRSVDRGESDLDEGRHLKLLNQVVGAIKNEVKIKDELLLQLAADIKNDVRTFEGLQEDFNRLETSLRSQHLKERGLESILKGHYNKVRDQDERMSILEQQNQEITNELKSKGDALNIMEEQIYVFVEELEDKRTELQKEKTQNSKLVAKLAQAKEDAKEHLRANEAKPSGRGKEELEELAHNLELDLQRMHQENNTQRLQMQRMQSELRKAQGKGTVEAERDTAFLRTQVQGQQLELRSMQNAIEDAREQSSALEEQLKLVRDRCAGQEERLARQDVEIVELEKDVRGAEEQRDMLVELMKSSDHMTVAEVRALCERLEEGVAETSHGMGSRLSAEQAARRSMEDRYRKDVGELKEAASRLRREVQSMERALVAERAKSRDLEPAAAELRSKEDECEALREALEMLRMEGLGGKVKPLSPRSGGHGATRDALDAANRHISQLMGAQAAMEGKIKDRERECARILEERDALSEQLAGDRQSRQRLLDENRRNRSSVQDLEAKVRYLMGQIKSLVYPRHKERDHLPQDQDGGESYIQAASEEKMERFLQTSAAERDEYVGELIYQYEEAINILQRQFIQQLSSQVDGFSTT